MTLPDDRRGGTSIPHDALTVRELLDLDAMRGARLIAGTGGLDRLIRRLNVMTVPDIVRWTKQEEFLLTTGYPLPRGSAEFCSLVEQLARNGLAGLGVKLDEYLAEVPSVALAVAESARFPIVVIPGANPLDDVLGQAFETIVNRQAAVLAKTQQLHDAFLRIALTGGGLAKLASELASILQGAEVVICDMTGFPLAASEPLDRVDVLELRGASGLLDISRLTAGVHEDSRSGTRQAVAVIRAGALHHGFVLAVERGQGFPIVAGPAVEQAALVAALEITRDLAVSAVHQQFASNALHDLVTAAPGSVTDAVARAASFRWNLQRRLAVFVARQGRGSADHPASAAATATRSESSAVRGIEAWSSAIRARDASAAVAGFATELVAVIGARDPVALARSVQADMSAATRQAYSIGVSQVGTGPDDIPRLYEEARIALDVGRRLSGIGAVTGFGGLGLYRLIAGVGLEELRTFVRDTLGPVLDLPEPGRTDLLRTLAVLLDTRFNVAETARVLHYHYNTMRYRVAKLERLLGDFADNAQASLRIGVALQILRMYEISGEGRKPLRLTPVAVQFARRFIWGRRMWLWPRSAGGVAVQHPDDRHQAGERQHRCRQ